jgi:hypothetical protein
VYSGLKPIQPIQIVNTQVHRWASFLQKPMVAPFPLLAEHKIETVTSFSLPAPQKNWNGSIVLVTCTQKIIETVQLFFLLLSQVEVMVNRSRYSIKQKMWNGKIVSVIFLLKKCNAYIVLVTRSLKKWNIYIILVTNVKLKRSHRSRYWILQKVIDL